jgi:hypothetical protein
MRSQTLEASTSQIKLYTNRIRLHTARVKIEEKQILTHNIKQKCKK